MTPAYASYELCDIGQIGEFVYICLLWVKFRRIYFHQKFFLGGCIDLGFRVEEEKVKAPNWLWFNEFF